MHRGSVAAVLSCGALLAGFAPAQTLEVGNIVSPPTFNDAGINDLRTVVDLARPATATGTLTSATFRWSAGCLAAAKLKFFRRQGGTLVYLTERGPFDTGDPTTVALVPPVDVQQGDLIGIARLTDCGNPLVSSPFPAAGYLEYEGDVTSNVELLAGMLFFTPDTLAVYATGTATQSVSRVFPVVGSTAGAFGSFFRTGVQLYNASESPQVGSFVYHPAGVVGSPADPSLDFTIPPSSVLSYSDLVETMGQSGLGSIDLVLPADAAVPVVVTRVFNDSGAGGTSGFTEELVDPDGGEVLFAGSTAFLIAPADATNFRLNIGVRTFFSGASLSIFVLTPTGSFVRPVEKTFDPTFFVQQRAEVFLEGPIGSNDIIEIRVRQGSAVVYGAMTDNTTNDPSIQFARVIAAP